MTTAIDVRDVTKRYGDFTALDSISARIGDGRVVGLLGHNGAGKSTLIKLILGLIAPTAGRIMVLGGRGGRRLRARTGYLPENVAFYGNLTGREVLAYLGAIKRVAPAEHDGLLERVGLVHAADRRVGTYSKGMRQRLGLAQALLGSPGLLLLDEPTTGLDPVATAEFFELIRELRSTGTTVLISSHVLAELEPHLDDALILGAGRVLASGSVQSLRDGAHLPVTFAVRLRSTHNAVQARALAARFGIRDKAPGGTMIEFDVPPADKMDVLKKLTAMPDVVDVDLREPTLARLYQHVGAGAAAVKGEQP